LFILTIYTVKLVYMLYILTLCVNIFVFGAEIKYFVQNDAFSSLL
jgi:hypothetical protein